MRRIDISFLFLLTLPFWVFAQDSLLQSGPMVGYAEMRNVMLWVQTKQPANVRIEYWTKNEPARRYSTATVATEQRTACCAKLLADSVEPGNDYEYALFINGVKIARNYRLAFQSLAPRVPGRRAADIRIAIGSCAYVDEEKFESADKPVGGDYRIFNSIASKRPNAMLWLGDNVYLRPKDWTTRGGILHRYTHTRSLPELQPLLGSAHHYAIWDDHDFGPNNSDGSFGNKEASLEAFTLFWPNPGFGVNGRPGVATTFVWGDVQFFLLDNRYYRSPNEGTAADRAMFGREQLEWLIDALVSSDARFKIIAVGGQVLNPLAVYETYVHYFPEERDMLLALIEKKRIEGVLFLSGDRHHSEVTKMERPDHYPLYDITSSPLTSPAHNRPDEPNAWRMHGTFAGRRNFILLDFAGKPDSNALFMTITCCDADGSELWKREISSSELSYPKKR